MQKLKCCEHAPSLTQVLVYPEKYMFVTEYFAGQRKKYIYDIDS